VGLDIGTTAVRAAEVSVGSDSATLHRFGQVALPDGAVRDGEIVDGDAVTEAIKQLWKQVRFNSKQVAIGVSNQRLVVRQVELPWLPTKELRASLGFQVGEYIPMPIEQAVLDFNVVEEFTSDNGRRMLRVLLVAAGKDHGPRGSPSRDPRWAHPGSSRPHPIRIVALTRRGRKRPGVGQ